MKNFARFTLDASFYEIAKEHYLRYVELEKQAASLNLDDPLDMQVTRHEIDTAQHKCALITICFSAMCLEAFIYDYAARHISDKYVQTNLDRLNALAKWVVIPRLVTGKDFPTESRAYLLLRLLVKTRNGLIHFKSSNVPSDQDALIKILRKQQDSPTLVKDCFSAIENLFLELRRLDSRNQYEGWYAFPGPYA